MMRISNTIFNFLGLTFAAIALPTLNSLANVNLTTGAFPDSDAQPQLVARQDYTIDYAGTCNPTVL